jgi:hypothetical protein
MYLNFEEFEMLGGNINAVNAGKFTLLEAKAESRIDFLTNNRIKAMATVPDPVKYAIVEIINLEAAAGSTAQVENPVVTSFSNDGYTEHYGNVYSVEKTKQEQDRIIFDFLGTVKDDNDIPLLYRGSEVTYKCF